MALGSYLGIDYPLLGLVPQTVRDICISGHLLQGCWTHSLSNPASLPPSPHPMPLRNCALEVQPPLETIIHLLIALLVAASYIPQLIKITSTGTENISGWYIILLTASATANLATRIRSIITCGAWACFKHGEVKGFRLLSALLVYLQAIVHWIAALILLAVFVSYRSKNQSSAAATNISTRSNTKDETSGPTGQATPPSATTSSAPSNVAVLAVVLTHAALTLPLAVYLNLITRTEDDDIEHIFFSLLYGALLRITSILTSLTAAIPQIKLMAAQSRANSHVSNSSQGSSSSSSSSLSLLGAGLQVIAFIALAASQGWRARDRGSEYSGRMDWIWDWDWWKKFLVGGGMGASWLALAVVRWLFWGLRLD
ncbi:hypothetical protein BJY00DRAFT_286369 [Aspergillus carlsbadensis]|nr:hypothetical protein BJY00DRAFT_286369 [Aspergillus carlsbadensis]